MSYQGLTNKERLLYTSDCENCFGLCCVALPFIRSADFATDKDGGVPCKNLKSDYRCGIHESLRDKGFKGCTVYECFGAGQKVSQVTYNGKDWRENTDTAKEMFDVFPVMQQLHEMLYYLQEALNLVETRSIHEELKDALQKTEGLTQLSPSAILKLHVSDHRAVVNELLVKTSEIIRSKVKRDNIHNNIGRGMDLIGAKLQGANLKGSNLRGAFLIAADLRNADLRSSDFIGADLRDTDVRGANLERSIFLTQAQINSANGDKNTRLPITLKTPTHWLT